MIDLGSKNGRRRLADEDQKKEPRHMSEAASNQAPPVQTPAPSKKSKKKSKKKPKNREMAKATLTAEQLAAFLEEGNLTIETPTSKIKLELADFDDDDFEDLKAASEQLDEIIENVEKNGTDLDDDDFEDDDDDDYDDDDYDDDLEDDDQED